MWFFLVSSSFHDSCSICTQFSLLNITVSPCCFFKCQHRIGFSKESHGVWCKLNLSTLLLSLYSKPWSSWKRAELCWGWSWIRGSGCRPSHSLLPQFVRQEALWSCDGRAPAGGQSRREGAAQTSRTAGPGEAELNTTFNKIHIVGLSTVENLYHPSMQARQVSAVCHILLSGTTTSVILFYRYSIKIV